GVRLTRRLTSPVRHAPRPAPMTLIGLDMSASRARASRGPAGAAPTLLSLDGSAEFPLAVSLAGRSLTVGEAARGVCRQTPHLVCMNFLPELGTARRWNAGRHHVDAPRALLVTFERLAKHVGRAQAIALALPAYLGEAQRGLVLEAARKVRWGTAGVIAAP